MPAWSTIRQVVMVNVRRWIWYPSIRSHAIAGALVLIGVTLLGLGGVPKFPAFKDYAEINADSHVLIFWTITLIVVNACLFYMQTRGDYLLVSAALIPTASTFFVLSTLFPM